MNIPSLGFARKSQLTNQWVLMEKSDKLESAYFYSRWLSWLVSSLLCCEMCVCGLGFTSFSHIKDDLRREWQSTVDRLFKARLEDTVSSYSNRQLTTIGRQPCRPVLRKVLGAILPRHTSEIQTLTVDGPVRPILRTRLHSAKVTSSTFQSSKLQITKKI